MYSLAELFAVLATYAVIRQWLLKWVHLPDEAYHQPVLFLQELQQPEILLWYLCCGCGAFLAARSMGWATWDGGSSVRIVVMIAAGVCAFAFSFYRMNYYLAEWHFWDRLLLLAFVVGIWRHPLWTGPFLAHLTVMVQQFQVPLHDFPWTDKRAPFALLMMFVAVLTISLWRRQTLSRFVALSLCLVAANYFWAGWQKLMIGWPWREDLSALFVNSYLNGWLRGMSESRVAQFDQLVEWTSPLMIVFTIATEVGAILLLTRKPVAMAVLVGCTLLHMGIFCVSGICFWKWCAVNLALVWLLWKAPPGFVTRVFQELRPAWLGLACILLAPIYARVTHFAWFDTPLSHQFDVEVVGRSGAIYPVSRGFFAPYDFTFAQNKFYYLSSDPIVVGTYGVTENLAISEDCCAVDTSAEYAELTTEHGQCESSHEREQRFGALLQVFLSNYAKEHQRQGDLDIEVVPHHIWSLGPPGQFAGQETITQIRVIRRDVSWDDDSGCRVLLRESLAGSWPPRNTLAANVVNSTERR